STIITYDVTGTVQGTRYWCRIEGSTVGPSRVGTVHTDGPVGEPYSYTFGSSSCAGHGTAFPGRGGLISGDRISYHPVFDQIREARPLFFIHSGDFHYYNLGSGSFGIAGGGSLANYRTGYDDVLIHCPRQAAMYRAVPLVHVWDDHEYGPNDADGTHSDKANAAQVYRERDPHYPLEESSGPIYHSFQVGRVLYVMLDSRYNRDPNDDPSPREYLGSTQLAWIEGLLDDPPDGADL